MKLNETLKQKFQEGENFNEIIAQEDTKHLTLQLPLKFSTWHPPYPCSTIFL